MLPSGENSGYSSIPLPGVLLAVRTFPARSATRTGPPFGESNTTSVPSGDQSVVHTDSVVGASRL